MLSETSVQGNPCPPCDPIIAAQSDISHLQSEGSESASLFCCSVEEVEDQDGEKQKEEEKERGEGEDYQESAKHIKVIETDFKRPLRSSFRAKKGGEKR